ncbi:PREDICTED: uncharacterized protein LOC108567742 isoform X2 [Nicrophorus vespilloides]|uniref:Uncharacterized protein LOC108567742 isoform X2 n=1 Tax=Nicrophorus vespilloides TaxID=110193 RepID=A0ABM1NAL9_NICVS|nr:PREDICTED: uncharacterized protein LOC108567742 isoform X2 [Nicrophorus vespilloides]
MFGNKLRSWMESVRPRKKQQRNKDKQKNITAEGASSNLSNKSVSVSYSTEKEMGNVESKSMQTIASQGARYSGANLSSPESAYSTGYSTDGTSPGAPPEYYINIRTEADKRQTVTEVIGHGGGETPKRLPEVPTPRPSPLQQKQQQLTPLPPRDNLSSHGDLERGPPTAVVQVNGSTPPSMDFIRGTTMVNASRLPESGITSPRQRNRIRTNPWVPGNNLSPGNSCVGLQGRQDSNTPRTSLVNSPVAVRYLSPTVPCSPINRPPRCDSLSSSSCSSLSAASLNWDASLVRDGSSHLKMLGRSPRVLSASDEEDDCTLNEMMGKYDESYIYEKETDILSDSDPTDCETDIDTGQDGGDEDDPLETEFDFIDNGSFLEFNINNDKNTGHCTYYNFEVQRRCSRRRTSRRSQKDLSPKNKTEKRRRSITGKKRQKIHNFNDGTRSAGATPVSARKTKTNQVSKLAIEDRFRKRSNSVSIPRDPVHFFDQRDKEADKKYKELIVEAEHILKNIKTNALSPRRLPGPTNKRVELLRTENTKPDAFVKNRITEDTSNLHIARIPSNFSPRFSPKRNHITKFINNNSPILLRRDLDKDVRGTPLPLRSNKKSSPLTRRQSKTDLSARRSPKYRKKLIRTKQTDSLSSDSEPETPKHKSKYNCPQSEPVKRKIYTNQSKGVAFNILRESLPYDDYIISDKNKRKSCETLRQQVLLNTIVNLKKSLEDQSASLKQAYRSSQNLHS